MKSKFSALYLCLAVVLAFCPAVSADNEYESRIQGYAEDIIDFNIKNHNGSVQEWIDASLAADAGNDSEWYIIALSQRGEKYDFSKYASSLLDYVQNRRITNFVTRQKYALALIACGFEDSDFVKQTIAESAEGYETLNVMGVIFTLHLLNNSDRNFDIEPIIERLLSLAKADGSWSVLSDTVDVTSMAIQALSPFYLTDEKVMTAVDRALVLLSQKQLEDGDFISYGVANAESVCQVTIALTSLGIDPFGDERFIKNGNTLLDGLLKYRLEDGSFSHLLEGGFSHTATVQSLCAFTAANRFYNEKGAFYDFSRQTENPGDESQEDSSEQAESSLTETTGPEESSNISTPSEETSEISGTDKEKPGYKAWVIAVIVFLTFTLCLVLFIRKKRKIKNYIMPVAIGIIAVLVVLLTDFHSPEGYYNDTTSKTNITGKVSITVRCDVIAGEESKYIPKSGVILEKEFFDIQNGDTVYDILIEAAKANKIQIETNGSSINGTIYVSGINYIYEYDYGDLSGWMYKVNGVNPALGCASYVLSDGEEIEWHYSLTIGKGMN